MKHWARRLVPVRARRWFDHRFGLRRRQRWIASRPNSGTDPVTEFDLVGLVSAWAEQDVIGATVANLLRQGCDRVLVIDNDGPDDSVAEAVAAGAVLTRTFSTDRYSAARVNEVANEVIAEHSGAARADHVWWLLADSDEFPHGPTGLTVRDYLGRLDRAFRVVGARTFDHYPSTRPHYVPGYHPLDFQLLCAEHLGPACRQGHWKHPLVRQDRGQALVRPTHGSHMARSDGEMVEPAQPIFVHHFRFRDEAATRARTEAAEARGPHWGGFSGRYLEGVRTAEWPHLDAVYDGRWDQLPPNELGPAATPRPWSDQVSPADAGVARWYSPESLQAAIEAD